MSAGVHVGLEVDGTRATVVTVEHGTVADIATVTAAGVEQAVEQALAKARADAPVRVALVSEGVLVRRVDVTEAALTHAAFADLAYAATGAPREGTTTAALLSDVTGVRAGLLGSGVAAVAPADPVTRLYKALTGRAGEVVPAPFTAHALEGVSLALRHTSADLTLVVDGHPVAHEQLRAGGLDVVEAVLGGGTEAGRTRLAAALTGQAAADPLAASTLERYLRQVLADVRDTLDAWARRGERVSSELYVYGPGARARALDVLLGDANLTPAEHRDISLALVHLPPAERSTAVAAYLAATTYGHGTPHAPFVSPDRLTQLERADRRTRARRRARTFGTAAALVLAGLLGPAGVGMATAMHADRELDAARNDLDAASATGHTVTDLRVREDAHARLAVTDDRAGWAGLLPRVVRTAPAGVRLDRVSAQVNGNQIIVDVTGTAESTDVQVVSDYLAALRRELKVPEALPRTVTATPDGTHFALTLTVAGTGR